MLARPKLIATKRGCLVRAEKLILGKWNVLKRTLLPNLKMGSWKNRSMFQSVALTYLTIQLSNKLIPLGPILKNMLHQMVGVKLSWIGCGLLWLLSDGYFCGLLVVAAATSSSKVEPRVVVSCGGICLWLVLFLPQEKAQYLLRKDSNQEFLSIFKSPSFSKPMLTSTNAVI